MESSQITDALNKARQSIAELTISDLFVDKDGSIDYELISEKVVCLAQTILNIESRDNKASKAQQNYLLSLLREQAGPLNDDAKNWIVKQMTYEGWVRALSADDASEAITFLKKNIKKEKS